MRLQLPCFRWLLALLAVTAVAACGVHRVARDDPYHSPELDAFLAFLREPDATRAKAEARLGPPQATFEGGRIAAYRPWSTKERRPGVASYSWVPSTDYVITYKTTCRPAMAGGCDQWMIQLMIEYDEDARVLRHTTTTPRAAGAVE